MKKRTEKSTPHKQTDKCPERLKPYVEMARKKEMDDVLIISPSKVVTAAWVRMKCEFGCAGFGKRHCCPPRTPTPEQTRAVLDCYSYAMLLHRRTSKDFEQMAPFNDEVTELEIAIFLDGFYKAFSMGSGPCLRCTTCNIAGDCVHPFKKRPSMEACGIDVYATAHAHGLPISVVKTRTEEKNIYGLILIE